MELEAQGLLLGQPFGMVARGAAACDDGEAVLVQTLADGSSDATHASGDICNFLAHEIFLDVLRSLSLNGRLHSSEFQATYR
jgi:hypothetical protein